MTAQIKTPAFFHGLRNWANAQSNKRQYRRMARSLMLENHHAIEELGYRSKDLLCAATGSFVNDKTQIVFERQRLNQGR